LEDRVEWARAGKVKADYLATDKAVEPTTTALGNPPRLTLNWNFARGLAEDQSLYLEFPLQTTGAHLPGEQEFVVKVTAYDRPGKGGQPDGHTLYAEMVLKVDITNEEALLGRTQPAFRDWDSLLLTSGGIPGSSSGSAGAKCCSAIGKGYRQPLSGVGF
jgi:hypothetical protein